MNKPKPSRKHIKYSKRELRRLKVKKELTKLTECNIKEIVAKYGWTMLEGEQQKMGSGLDIYAVQIEDHQKLSLLIDDGYCFHHGRPYRIFIYLDDDFNCCMFEGVVEYEHEFRIINKCTVGYDCR